MRVSSFSHSLALLAILARLDGLFAVPIPEETCEDPRAPAAPAPVQRSDVAPEFWAGADIGTLMRAEAIPNRVFFDYDGKTLKDPFQVMGDAGINSFRVGTSRTRCTEPSVFNNSGDFWQRERNFRLDFGCVDTQVQLAKRGIAQGMKFQLTMDMGRDIPAAWESYDYQQMLEAVKTDIKRQLKPFLDEKIVPDIILFENEGTDGMLFTEETTGHDRGIHDGRASDEQIEKELCGIKPHGNIASYPLLSGFYKAEVQACNEAIIAAGLSTAAIRYGLHSHGQYVQWKESLVHGPNAASQTSKTTQDGTVCNFTSIIPDDILAQNASEILTIMGFSSYPDPMTPEDINSEISIMATLERMNATLTQLQGYAEAYGRYTEGPHAGQHKLRGFGVEYATAYSHDRNEIPQQQTHTERMWTLAKRFDSFLGMQWWEPWYCNNNWAGSNAALCHFIEDGSMMNIAPTDTMKTWGAAAVSPWKAT